MLSIGFSSYIVRFDSRVAIGRRIIVLINNINRLPATPSKPRPRYIIRLKASIPYVQGRLLDIARPAGASTSGAENAPAS
jgi:hypothetical protein